MIEVLHASVLVLAIGPTHTAKIRPRCLDAPIPASLIVYAVEPAVASR